ncbi:MAG: bifunctional nuclease family protein [Gemmatimonadota bacterium]|nr:bifunctional nuclease family protein [Gemmatimonadota bacterium]
MVEVRIDIERTLNALRPVQVSQPRMIWLCNSEHNVLLPIVIGLMEASAIYAELTNERPPRPLTHDLVRSILGQLNTTIDGVYIVALKKGIFYAELALASGAKRWRVDARPSDCVALALRYEVPIYVSEAVITEAGHEDRPGVGAEEPETIEAWTPPKLTEDKEEAVMTVAEVPKSGTADAGDPVEMRINDLRRKMEQASRQERYEEAGRLRDEIDRLENSREA